MRRGEVWRADLTPRSGSEQRGLRPVVVIGNDGFNRALSWRSIIVVPISSSARQAARVATAVPLPAGSGGLTQDSLALCHQVTTLDRSKLVARLGTLEAQELAAVEQGIRVALDLPD